MIIYQRKNGNQHAKNALIIIPSVRAAFFSRRILVMAHGSTWCMLCRCTAMPLIWRCFSNSNAATFDLYWRVLDGGFSVESKNINTYGLQLMMMMLSFAVCISIDCGFGFVVVVFVDVILVKHVGCVHIRIPAKQVVLFWGKKIVYE